MAMDFNELYSQICGEYILGDKELNIFAKGKKCAGLSEKAYNLKWSINSRLGADPEEDDELSAFQDALTAIGKESAKQVYLY